MTTVPQRSGPGMPQTSPALMQHRPHTNGTNVAAMYGITPDVTAVSRPLTALEGASRASRSTDTDTETAHPIVRGSLRAAWLQIMLPADRPRRVAEMLASGDKKYVTIKGEFTAAMIEAHIQGRTTYATTLDLDGLARLGIVDRDEGGEEALIADLARLKRTGIAAVAIAMTTPGGHSGGHVITAYDSFYPAADIRSQLTSVLKDVNEVWPGSNQGVRLPIGYHKRARSWGTMLTINQAGAIERLDLNDPAQRQQAWRILMAIRNPAPPVAPIVEKPAPTPIIHRTSPRTAGHQDYREIRARFNAEHSWESLLERYGGQQRRDGWTCNCGYAHSHAVQLVVTNQDKLVSYSPNCRWAPLSGTGKAQDKFGLYCLVEHHNNAAAAFQAYNPIEPRTKAAPTPEHRTADAERKRQERDRTREAARSAAAELQSQIADRAANDADLKPRAQIVLQLLLDCARDRDWCRPSIAALCSFSAKLRTNGEPYSDRCIQLALNELMQAGYIVCDDRTGRNRQTTIWRFVARQTAEVWVKCDQAEKALDPPVCAEISPEYISSTNSGSESGIASEAPPIVVPDPVVPSATPWRDLLSEVRRLAREACEAEWYHRDYNSYDLWALTRERDRLRSVIREKGEPTVTELHGPDGAIAYPGGAAWLPTKAAEDWYETEVMQPVAVPQPPIEPGAIIELDPPADEEPAQPARRVPLTPTVAPAYREQLRRMSATELLGEQTKHTRTIKKHGMHFWVQQVRDKLAAVNMELEQRVGGDIPEPTNRPAAELWPDLAPEPTPDRPKQRRSGRRSPAINHFGLTHAMQGVAQ